MGNEDSRQVRTILIFRIGQLGDTLLSLPAIRAIRQRHPSHRMVLLTERQPPGSGYVSSWDVLEPTGWFDEVMFYTSAPTLQGKLSTMFSLAKRIRALRPDFIYNLAPERTLRQSRRDRFFFKWVAGAKEYRGGGLLIKSSKNMNGVLPRFDPEWRRLLHVIGMDAELANFRLPIPEKERLRAQQLIREKALDDGDQLLAVGPGSKMPAKVWARDRFREMGRRLLEIYPDTHLLVMGGKEDVTLGDELCVAWGRRSCNLAGRLSVYGSAAVLQRCLAYIGNDTGAMHLAGMVGIPCVALFSARDYPGQWEPYGEGHVILRHETECAGCLQTVCPYDNKCLDLISVDEAIHAVRDVVTSQGTWSVARA
ncbi:MAG: glycosyltransferase family 9 protein [Gammaproteobacteria bacterium]|nr:MAG: glycosyltransferase family 9 protein [Gammaproteobacteria bacterium]